MKIKCPGCSAVLNIPETAAGKVVKCPCGKQLRAPGGPAGGAKPGPAKPAAAKPGAARPGAAKPGVARPGAAKPAAPARPSPGGGSEGFDSAMFDELTAQDLKPMPSARPAAPRAPAGGGKLMQQYAPSGGGGGGQFRRGPIASPWVRLGAAIIDGFVIGFLVAPVLIGLMFVLTPMFVDTAALQNAQELSQGERDALAAQAAGGFMMAYLISVAISYSIPIVIYAIMVTKSGQTPGKKICGIRIVTADRQELPGFVKGVLLRSWLINVLYAIPMLALIDFAMIFGEKRQCLHDLLAGTIVIES